MSHTRFRRGKEHVGRLLVPARTGDLRWKITSQPSWVERLFGLDTVVEIKQVLKWNRQEKRYS
jgi:hypothetical protein